VQGAVLALVVRQWNTNLYDHAWSNEHCVVFRNMKG
jgi:hypothetical protein